MADFLFLSLNSLWTVTAAMKSADDRFLAGKRCQTWAVCWKAETLLCRHRCV